MLYRGVNKITDESNGGRLIPKGNSVKVTILADGKCGYDGKFKFGPCESNTARAHQIASGLYAGCGVSTTRSEEKAVYFATFKYSQDGYVYVIDESLLACANVSCHEFSDSIYPEEMEVTLIENSGGDIPNNVVVRKYSVTASGEVK